MNLNLGLVAIFITLFIIIGAVATRRCVECMIVGSMVAAVFFERFWFSYHIKLAEPFLFASIFPAMVFLLGAVLVFTTGSDWGMSSIITPIVFPLGVALGANPILIMAAIISGGTFGSHACFYADATLLASQSSGVENMEHALSQIPYVIIASAISIVCFVIAGFVM